MQITLSAKNKVGFVNGTILEPDVVTNPLEHAAWERCNDLVISWIFFNLDPNIAKSVLHIKTASSMWKDLSDRFGYACLTQIYNLEQQIANLTQGSLTVVEFYTAIKAIWDEMNGVDHVPQCTCNKCTCDVSKRILDRELRQRLLCFMMKLGDYFSTIRGNVLMMTPLPDVTQVYRIFAQEESHKEISKLQIQNVSNDLMACVADRKVIPSAGSDVQAYKNKPPNVYVRQGVNTKTYSGNKRPNSMFYCTHCKIPGHSYERCFKVHGYPPGFKANKEKRVAAMTHVPGTIHVQEIESEGAESTKSVPFTTTQYSYLMNLTHSNKGNEDSNKGVDGSMEVSGQALLAD